MPSSLWILDGGTGREIQARGGPFRQPEWSALALYEQPDLIPKIHTSYIESGAQGITTNSYAIVPFHLGVERYEHDRKRLLRLSMELAHRSKAKAKVKAKEQSPSASVPQMVPQIIGSIPPLCGSYEPEKFNPTVAGPILKDFLEAYTGDMGVDMLLLETVGSIAEARFYLEQISKWFATSSSQTTTALPVWLSFCIKANYGIHQPPRLLTDESLTQAIQDISSKDGNNDLLEQANVQAILVNCCDVRVVKDALVELKVAMQRRPLQLGAYPNAFSIPPPDAANHTLRQVDYNITPAIFAKYAKEWQEVGATIIGGCCGVGPEHIQALTDLSNSASSSGG